jgi:hypothetical protein
MNRVVTEAAWSFDLVIERLVEAWSLLRRMPDREAAWMRLHAKDGPWTQTVPERIGRYEEDAPVRLGLRASEVDRMNEALGWLDLIRPGDRKLIGLALARLSTGQAHVDWADLRAPMAWDGSPDALRKRFSRGISLIAHSLNRRKSYEQPVKVSNSH